MNWQYWFLFGLMTSVAALSVFAKKLTPPAAITGIVIGVCIYVGAGFTGICMMAAFFVLGTLATSWQIKKKKATHISEENNGERKAGQVVANAGMAALLGYLSYLFPEKSALLVVMMTSAFSSATADTLSSELGNVYGRRFYNILSFQKDTRGLDGVISLEGTLAGMAGSIVIAFVYALGFGWNVYLLFVIVAAGTVGNLSDSLLGAAFERKGVLQNNVVNFLNTLIASLAAAILF